MHQDKLCLLTFSSSRSCSGHLFRSSFIGRTVGLIHAVCAQGARPELLPERLLGSVRFSRLDLKTAIPLNPDDYPDDLLEDFPLSPSSVPQSPHPTAFTSVGINPTPEAGMELSQSIQSLHSLRSGSATGSNMSAQDVGHLEALRQASGSSSGQGQAQSVADRSAFASGPTVPQHTGPGSMLSSHPVLGSGHMGSGQMGPGHMGSGHMGSGHMASGQPARTASLSHQPAGLSPVPETRQSPSTATQQTFLRSQSMQPQHVSEAKATGGSNLRNIRGNPAERVRWTDKAALSGHV